jgi:suppressor of fused
MGNEFEYDAIGWKAIDDAIERIYRKQEPVHYGTEVPFFLGGKDPLQGVSIFRNESDSPEGSDYWHYVTYGFSELFEKESDDLDLSGYGFELTFRLAVSRQEKDAPIWPVDFLQNLGRYVFETGSGFAPGHHLELNGPIEVESPDTSIRAVTMIEDDLFQTISTPHGRVTFVQVVGTTEAENRAILSWNGVSVLETMRKWNPSLVTDLGRSCLMDTDAFAAAVQEGARTEGSSTGMSLAQEITIEFPSPDAIEVVLGALEATDLLKTLPYRIPFGRVYGVMGETSGALFAPENWDGAKSTPTDEDHEGEGLELITLTQGDVDTIVETVQPVRGEYRINPQLLIRVVPSVILDAEDNPIEEIG